MFVKFEINKKREYWWLSIFSSLLFALVGVIMGVALWCAAAIACSSAIFAGSTGGRLSAAGSAAAEADATAGGREPKIANPGSGGCPGGNCPSNPPAGGSYGYYYPGWSWGNPYGWSWGYQSAKSQLT